MMTWTPLHTPKVSQCTKQLKWGKEESMSSSYGLFLPPEPFVLSLSKHEWRLVGMASAFPFILRQAQDERKSLNWLANSQIVGFNSNPTKLP
jgi:hypothetical protein